MTSKKRYRVLLAHPHAFTMASHCLCDHYDLLTSVYFEIYEQANARIRRIGQKNKQLFLHLQSTQIEKKVYAMLRNKKRTQDAFLEMIRTSTTNGELHAES
jgi:hypothetical protein